MRSLGVVVIALSLACHKGEDRHAPALVDAAFVLEIVVDGTPATWGPAELAPVPKFGSTNKEGEARDVWSLRELAGTLVGPGARVTAVTGGSGGRGRTERGRTPRSRT